MGDMPRGRRFHSCGIVTHPERGPEIVAVGGVDTERVLDTVDIYTVNTGFWREANNLPIPITEAALVPYRDSFLLVGGSMNDTPGGPRLSDIYRYNAAEDEWIKLAGALKTPRSLHAAFLVSQSLFPGCKVV